MEESGELKEYEKKGEFYPYQLKAQKALVDELGNEKIMDIQNKSLDYFNSLYQGKLLVFSYPNHYANYGTFLKSLAIKRPLTYFYSDFPSLDPHTQLLPDRHPNKSGYKFIAEKLSKFMTSNKIISCN